MVWINRKRCLLTRRYLINLTPAVTEFNWQLELAQDWLCEKLSKERYRHSLGTYEKAVELAQHFTQDETTLKQVALAGLLHDAAKWMGPEALFSYCKTHGVPFSEAEEESPQTLHPFVGAHMVQQDLEIQDETILNAIRYHTTGRAHMGFVEKIVFIADKIEENTRNPLFIKRTTEHLNFKDETSLNRTILYLLESTIMFVMEKRQVIHPRTLEARNDLIRVEKRKNSPKSLNNAK